ncbi:WRKY transcription factor WRKY28-like [Triticum dicoccoides]|uniref:WRKY transcription factor WRKY28-like n=1 Tax=Triticum dicoccoides TaxID=85692 RepID=UPI001890610D|nr:WRKY transcription factor WRKY28-like [Triticum dicoccoides]
MAALVTPAASVVSELVVRGRESAAVLEALLQGSSPQEHGGIRELAAEILLCCDRALAALHGCHGVDAIAHAGRKRKSGPDGAAAQTRPKRWMRASSGSTATRVEKRSTAEDGFIWRKYGQKEITHSKHPRLYFRCSYKHDIGCPATRQVQQADDDLSLYVITYFGDHTCCQGNGAVAAAEEEDVKMQPFVINFGSATASSTSGSPWQNSHDGDGRSEISRLPQALCLPEGGEDELGLKVTKVETTSLDSQPAGPAAAELSSSPDVSCASPAWDPLSSCLEWDQFTESSFDFVSEFINFEGIALYQ